jgi:hypothetical protein
LTSTEVVEIETADDGARVQTVVTSRGALLLRASSLPPALGLRNKHNRGSSSARIYANRTRARADALP